MPFSWNPREHLSLAIYAVKWFCLSAPVAAVIGSACALFLLSLEKATSARFAAPWLLFLLPLAGIAISLIYGRVGKSAEGGNNLLMDAIHGQDMGDSAVVVPARMAPLILVSTVMTHLFGGSAGREGTAIQMGGSIASAMGRWFHINNADLRILLMVGISAGFGGVFGTPLAGTIFAMEVLAVGRMNYEALIPCLMGAVIGDWSCVAWGIHHTHYSIAASGLQPGNLSWMLALKTALAASLFGLASVLFAETTHGISNAFKRYIHRPYLRPFAGGLIIIALVYILGTRDYLGLGVFSNNADSVTISSCFSPGGADNLSWFWKILFTAITLGSGFKGGEVTPLFFIGAALGNLLGRLLGAPVDLFAGLGFVAVFAGAANTPLACTIMGIELFGSQYTIYFAIACFLSYLCSGHSGIYLSQIIGSPKLRSPHLPPLATLRTARELRHGRFSFSRRRSGKNKNTGSQETQHDFKVKK